jgi:predicted dehydrogenase
MAQQTFGVGFIGVEPNRSWAARAHIPALRALSDRFRIAGVANSTAESSRKAAEALGIERAFSSVEELIVDPNVDIVAVTVKVPSHFELVSKALNAGKHVYCEWPLGRDVDEAVQLDQLAREKGVHAVIGTQALRAPAVRYVKDLVAQGFLGDVLSITLVGTGGNWGAEMDLVNAYCLDISNGATMLTIPFGHTIAAVEDIFGQIESVSAELAIQRKTVKIKETGEERPNTTPDQILVAGVFKSGVLLDAHYRGSSNAGTGLLLEINGTAGNLQITGPFGHMQLAPLTLNGARGANTPLAVLPIPEKYSSFGDLKGPPANVGAIYADLYADLTEETHHAPTFANAVRNHRLLAAIETSAATGKRQIVER